ncbi:serine/threonine-protein kinase PDIK1L [Amia ocellicauda]|uniref:serine/threonine-protein kinase PDIK1L n=1 Tax=Amia ocellicauda TaxID=2972642 RepID=UPI0034641A03
MEQVYTLVREVGRGSYGVVFEGKSADRGERVAIKRLLCSSPESVELYLQEVRALQASGDSHPNVISLHRCLLQTAPKAFQPLRCSPGGTSLPLELVESTLKGKICPPQQCQRRRPSRRPPASGCAVLWLVMEFCEGGDLNQYLLSRPPNPSLHRSVLRQLSSALAFLHGRHIVHRDLKPDNVLVAASPTGPLFRVGDFGLSRISGGSSDTSRQSFSSTCGSEFYMAPEVWEGDYAAKADIFSLGVLFWAVLERITFLEEDSGRELLGAYLGQGSSLVPIGKALLKNPGRKLPIPLRARRPMHPELRTLLQDMLAFDPKHRPEALELELRVRQATAEDY